MQRRASLFLVLWVAAVTIWNNHRVADHFPDIDLSRKRRWAPANWGSECG
jgi:hypothetical protein